MPDVIERRLADLGEFIRQQREVARMSVRRLADLAEISNPYLSQIERGLRRPSAEILQQIAKALRISAETLYVRAGILEPSVGQDVSVPDAITRDERLSLEQKASLLIVYLSFVSQSVEADEPGPTATPVKKTSSATKAPAAKTPAAR